MKTPSQNSASETLQNILRSLPPAIKQALPFYMLANPSLPLAQQLQSKGYSAEAVVVLELLLQTEPTNTEALHRLALAANRRGNRDEARTYFTRFYNQQISNTGLDSAYKEDALAYLLSTVGFGEPPNRVPTAYLENQFDRFSSYFEERLVERLAYRVPELLYDAFCDAVNIDSAVGKYREVMDLGCGTGLAGQYFSSISKRMVGVDISEKMLEQAAQKAIYNELVVNDIEVYLKSEKWVINVFVATDVFIYFGDLGVILTACNNRQTKGGLLAFSVEALNETLGTEYADYQLVGSGRYHHSRAYIKAVAYQTDYRILSCSEQILRREHGYDVHGYLCVLEAN